MGYCIGKCRDLKWCFFVKNYFMCHHLVCYSVASKFGCCIKRGNATFRYYMSENREEVAMSHTILRTTYCYCVKCCLIWPSGFIDF